MKGKSGDQKGISRDLGQAGRAGKGSVLAKAGRLSVESRGGLKAWRKGAPEPGRGRWESGTGKLISDKTSGVAKKNRKGGDGGVT